MALAGTGADGLDTDGAARSSLAESKGMGEKARSGCERSAGMALCVPECFFFPSKPITGCSELSRSGADESRRAFAGGCLMSF